MSLSVCVRNGRACVVKLMRWLPVPMRNDLRIGRRAVAFQHRFRIGHGIAVVQIADDPFDAGVVVQDRAAVRDIDRAAIHLMNGRVTARTRPVSRTLRPRCYEAACEVVSPKRGSDLFHEGNAAVAFGDDEHVRHERRFRIVREQERLNRLFDRRRCEARTGILRRSIAPHARAASLCSSFAYGVMKCLRKQIVHACGPLLP